MGVGSNDSNITTASSSAELWNDHLSNEDDWALDSAGNIRFDWQVNGFEDK